MMMIIIIILAVSCILAVDHSTVNQ